MKCSKCGTNVTKDDKFCPDCGTKMIISKEKKIESNHCSKCGAKLGKEDTFCPECGAKKKSNNKMIYIISGIVLLILIIAITSITILSKHNTKNESITNTNVGNTNNNNQVKETTITKSENIPTPSNEENYATNNKIDLFIIEDKRCTSCDSTRISSIMKQFFPELNIVKIDYSTTKGKEMYNIGGEKYLPMFIVENKISEESNFTNLKNAMIQKNNYYVIQATAVGAIFDPNAEICTNGIDDNADGIIDCADSKCSQSLECRTELKKNIQLFIMSDCPYGKKAVEALFEAKKNFGTEMNYDIHYIASDNGDGTFNSLHGTYEADEDIRQLCAKKQAPTKYLDYVNCRSLEGIRGNDYTKCVTSTGLDLTAIKSCSNSEEGKSLLREDIKIAEALRIGASPTWIANNRYEFSGIDAETVKINFCKYNTGIVGCDKTLSSDPNVPIDAGCGSS